MNNYTEFFMSETGKTEEWLKTYRQIGSILANELTWGGYIVGDEAEKGRWVDNRLKNDKAGLELNLYDVGEGDSYARYSRTEVNKVLEYLGLKPEVQTEDTFFSVFPVSEYMSLFDELCPRRGVVLSDDGSVFDKIEIDDTEFFTEQWFENFDECYKEEEGNIDTLAWQLSNYVSEYASECFDFCTVKSQWEVFCKWTGYLKNEDYFGVLSDNPDYERLLVNDTYLSKEDALTKIEEHIATLDKQLLLELEGK